MEYNFPKHYYVIAFLLGCLFATILIGCEEHTRCSISNKNLNLYQQYYHSTEALLDSLENNFNWQDRYDSEAIDDYYNKRRQLRVFVR